MRLLAALILLCSLVRPTLAQQAKTTTDKTEELRDLVARRIQRATGQRVQIPYLAYNVFTSTFIGKRIEVGPKEQPYLHVPKIDVEMVLLSDAPGTTVARIEVVKPKVILPLAWLHKPFRYQVYRPVTVRVGTLSDGRIAIQYAKGRELRLQGAHLTVSNLRVPVTAAGRAPRLSGALTLRAKAVVLRDGYQLKALLAKGRLEEGRLTLEQISADSPDGPLALKGNITIGGRRGIGPVDLSGEVSLAWGDAKVRIRGRSLARVGVTGRISPRSKSVPRRGGLVGVPPLRLRLGVGKKTLRGTAERWRIR